MGGVWGELLFVEGRERSPAEMWYHSRISVSAKLYSVAQSSPSEVAVSTRGSDLCYLLIYCYSGRTPVPILRLINLLMNASSASALAQQYLAAT